MGCSRPPRRSLRPAPPPAPRGPVALRPGPQGLPGHGAATRTSKVWYTVADGVLSDVYEPTIDTTNVETLQYVVTDGHTFTDLQTRDMTYTVSADPSGMACTVASTGEERPLPDRHRLPDRSRPRQRADGHPPRRPAPDRRDAAGSTPASTRTVERQRRRRQRQRRARRRRHRPLHRRTRSRCPATPTPPPTPPTATTREPTSLALRADRPFLAASSGYAGTASDGLTQLDASHAAHRPTPRRAPTATSCRPPQVDAAHGRRSRWRSASARTPDRGGGDGGPRAEPLVRRRPDGLPRGWSSYDEQLNGRRPAARPVHGAARRSWTVTYYLSANVLKASEDKTFPAPSSPALASPWGQAVRPGTRREPPTSAPTARSSPATSTRRSPASDRRRPGHGEGHHPVPVHRQQLADGPMPRNCLLNGKTAPDTFGTQLDETAYPILMAWQSGLTGARLYRRAHQARCGLPGRPRAVLRLGAVGGAERLLAVDDRGRDRRPGGGRPARRA